MKKAEQSPSFFNCENHHIKVNLNQEIKNIFYGRIMY
jgi:hypothetical protein